MATPGYGFGPEDAAVYWAEYSRLKAAWEQARVDAARAEIAAMKDAIAALGAITGQPDVVAITAAYAEAPLVTEAEVAEFDRRPVPATLLLNMRHCRQGPREFEGFC